MRPARARSYPLSRGIRKLSEGTFDMMFVMILDKSDRSLWFRWVVFPLVVLHSGLTSGGRDCILSMRRCGSFRSRAFGRHLGRLFSGCSVNLARFARLGCGAGPTGSENVRVITRKHITKRTEIHCRNAYFTRDAQNE